MSFDKYHIKKPGFDIEPHEVFLDKMAQSEEEEIGVSVKKFEVPLKAAASYFLFGVFAILALFLASKVGYFQIVEGESLHTQAENNKGSISLVVPERGIIYDKNMEKLVLNSPAYDLICDRARFSFSSESVSIEIKNIAEAVGMAPHEVAEKIQKTDSSDVLVADSVDHEKIIALETKIDDLPGCRILKNTAREYVYGPAFSQVLGYTGRINREEYSNQKGYAINDYIGKTGLEKYYESYLRGQPGESRVIRSAVGVESKSQIVVPPESGSNLVLSIDADLQQKLYNSLGASLERMGASKGAAVAMDPTTGAVMALVSYPSYDDNLFSGGISQEEYSKLQDDPDQPFFNRAIQAQYPTGSIIKPFEASAALQEKLISPQKQINDQGYILVQSQYDPEVVYRYGAVKAHGWVDIKKALAVSSNVYFYTIGGGYGDQKGLGPTKIKEYLSLFGWSEKTGIDLPGEFSGLIPDPAWKKATKGSSWVDGDTYNLSIGQSDLQTTPLQVATAYCAIANRGTLYKPQIVSKIISPSTGAGQAETVKEFEPQIIRDNFIDLENLEIVREGMRDGVYQSYGISKSLADLPVEVAAKTGTAEIGYKDLFNVWSAVFAPYENPEIVLVVTAEKVDGLGAVTLPVVHEVLEWYFSGKSE